MSCILKALSQTFEMKGERVGNAIVILIYYSY